MRAMWFLRILPSLCVHRRFFPMIDAVVTMETLRLEALARERLRKARNDVTCNYDIEI